ncbi:MAG: AAA family ATPase [Deltaproteobacteria bacterium]|nr:AAA family ATPase [Deltaproteobacteria bacterium]
MEDFKRADFLNHFLIGTEEGLTLLNEYFGTDDPPTIKKLKVYKIAPEEHAALWPKWLQEKIASIGWDELGDLSGLNWEDFKEIRDTVGEKRGWSNRKLNQVWEFAQIPVGSIIVANKGTGEVVGIGKVTKGYYFIDVDEHGHRLDVDWYDTTSRKVNMPGWKKTLVPLDEATLKEITGKSPVPDPEALFSSTSFELLGELVTAPKKETYLAKKDQFQKFVLDPFQNLFKTAVSKLPDAITDRVETEKDVFSRILKNDYGRGGAWPHYWGALYPKGGSRIKDPQLFIYMFSHAIRFGFYIGEYGSEQRELFQQRCQSDRTELLLLLRSYLKSPKLYFGDREDSDEPEKEELYKERQLSFKDWLKDPIKNGIHVSVQLSEEEVMSKSRDELVQVAVDTWETLFPLFLMALDDAPVPVIREYLGIEKPPVIIQPEYPLPLVAKQTGFNLDEIERWVNAIGRKGQGVLYGPPGTGKTFVARKLAKHLVGGGDGFTEFVQFHPAYAYEDFMQGIRPQTKDGALEYFLEPGRFLTFCKDAQNREGTCVLIIDEINRANLARVFGELMYLLEYRNESIPLAGGNRLEIPKNVRLIGTMNTADRSIALVDHALRRRFAFIPLFPSYEVMTNFHENSGFDPSNLIEILQKINRQINDPHYEIGISFFLQEDLPNHLEDIWRMEIEPYLEEYFFDKPDKVEGFRWTKIKEKL